MTGATRPDIPAAPEPVPEAAVDAALTAVALFWKEAHAILQAYPSAALARVMLEAAAPLIRAAERERAEAELAATREALRAHMQSFTDPKGGGELCGGCLRPSPCPDAALAGGGEA